MSDGTNSATYTYLANSPLVSQIAFKQNATTRMTTTKVYDFLNRLKSISSVSAVTTNSFVYSYNNANQRSGVTNVDNSKWVYQYDDLGQVISGKKYWSDGTPVAGQQFEYAFDDIGNRTSTKAGGDQSGANLRSATYDANALNQYDSRTVPGAVDILGSATNAATVTVNNQPTYRKGNYFRDQLALNNGSAAVWAGITNVAALNNGTNSDIVATNLGYVFLPKTPESFSYDADGNLTQDGRWQYTWDGENRLVNMTSLTNAPTASKLKLDFAYDYMGRRVQKTVSTNNGSGYFPLYTNRFIYDGWNLLAELNPSHTVIRSFVWGTDLSGTMQDAGGVGGLLVVSDSALGSSFVAFDGNGNVNGLTRITDGSTVAQYQYGPFGEAIRATGPMAKANPFRFSTKYQDDETDLLYYGYRYYNASTGRWGSRDPLGELGFEATRVSDDEEIIGSPNSYVFIGNTPTTQVDLLGLRSCKEICKAIIDGSYPPPIAGFVGCEDGKKCPCNAKWDAMGYNPGDCPEIDKSVLKHEKKHFDDVSCPKGCGLKIAPWKDDMSNEDKEKSECERAEEDIKTLQKLAKKLTGNCQTVAKNLLDFKQKYVKDHNCDSFKKK